MLVILFPQLMLLTIASTLPLLCAKYCSVSFVYHPYNFPMNNSGLFSDTRDLSLYSWGYC